MNIEVELTPSDYRYISIAREVPLGDKGYAWGKKLNIEQGISNNES